MCLLLHNLSKEEVFCLLIHLDSSDNGPLALSSLHHLCPSSGNAPFFARSTAAVSCNQHVSHALQPWYPSTAIVPIAPMVSSQPIHSIFEGEGGRPPACPIGQQQQPPSTLDSLHCRWSSNSDDALYTCTMLAGWCQWPEELSHLLPVII